MNKYIFALTIILSFYTIDINAQFIEIKKEKVVLDNKPAVTQKVLPSVIEDSIVIKSAKNNIQELPKVRTRGKYSYLLEPLTDPLIDIVQKNSSMTNIDGLIDTSSLYSSTVALDDTNKEKLRVVLVGTNEKVMFTDGSFVISFKDKSYQSKFSEDYNLEEVQQFPDFTSFKSKDFNGINNLLKRINQDPRISFIELNLIDPDLKTN